MLKRLLLALTALALLATAFWWWTQPTPDASPRLEVGNATPDVTGFARAYEPRAFSLPADHGPHPDFQTEWWYYTGNLQTAAGEHFGYQFTIFRRAITPTAPNRLSNFAASQIYLGHFALTDVSSGQHTSTERFSRGAAGLAGASSEPFSVWLEDWTVTALNADGSEVRVVAREGDIAIDLTLVARKPIVLQGDQGLSQKSETPGNASYYLSYTHMDTSGFVVRGGVAAAVEGTSWFDHEWSTSALGADILGWDWFSLQLGDGREVMFYQFRRTDGQIGALSSGTLIEADGTTRRLAASEVQLEVLTQWQSPHSGGIYPAKWRLAIPSAQIDLTIEPWLNDQEMQVSFVYWEGAVKFTGLSQGQNISGNGYVELTGYVTKLNDVF